MVSKLPFKKLISTGIDGLDEILLGGIRAGNTILLEGITGTGRSTIALEFLLKGAMKYKEAGYLVTLNSSRINVIRDGVEFSWDIQSIENQQLLKITEMDPRDLAKEVLNNSGEFIQQLKKLNIKRLAIDGFALMKPYIENLGEVSYSQAISKFFRVIQSMGITTIITKDLQHNSPIGDTGACEEQFIADSVISVGNSARGKSVHRFIEVVKSRGQDFFTGRHSMKIVGGTGVKVFPRASVRAKDFDPEDIQPTSIVRCSVGNPVLDEMLGGGVYQGSVTLVAGISGTGKSVAALQFLMEGVRAGQKCLLMSLEEHPQQIRRNAESLRIDIAGEEKKGNIILAYDGPLELNLDAHLQDIKDLIETHKVNRVVIDSLASYEIVNPQEAREFIFSLASFLKKRLIVSFFNYESPELLGVSQISKDIKASAIVDNIVLLSYVEISTLLRRAITVPKARGSKPAQRTKEYVIQQGGIEILDDSTILNVPFVPQLPLSSYYGVLARSPTRTSPVIDDTLASGKDLPLSSMPVPGPKRKKR